MRKPQIALAMALALLWLLGAQASMAQSGRTETGLDILFTADVAGYIMPCPQ